MVGGRSILRISEPHREGKRLKALGKKELRARQVFLLGAVGVNLSMETPCVGYWG